MSPTTETYILYIFYLHQDVRLQFDMGGGGGSIYREEKIVGGWQDISGQGIDMEQWCKISKPGNMGHPVS